MYDYSPHSLQQEVEVRFGSGRVFDEKEIWSILCSCSLALAFLERGGMCPGLVTSEDIRLTEEGVVKLLDHEATATSHRGFLTLKRNHYYSPEYLTQGNSSKGSVFSFGMCLMEIMYLEPINDCYDYE